MRVRGKILVVTGAGSGIGRAVTIEAIRRSARVAAVDLDARGLAETARQVVAPLLISTHRVDLTDRAAVEALPAVVSDRWGAVDGLLHCAEMADLDRIRAFLPMLRTRPEAHLVDVAGLGDLSPAAVKVVAETLRAECAGTNIRVTVAAAAPRRGTGVVAPDRAAREILDAVERNRQRVVVTPDPGRGGTRIGDRLRQLFGPRTSSGRR